MTGRDHLSRETLVRVFDGELSTAERLEIDVHLSQCEQCLDTFDQVAELSNDIAQLMDGMSVAKPRQARERLAEKMTAIAAPQQRDRTSKKLMLWAAAAVALLA
jgi:anti-sigma factor RsiW